MKSGRILVRATAAASAAAWLVLAFARGRFWLAEPDEHLGASRVSSNVPAPRVEAVVPARDESRTIDAALRSLVAQRYDGSLAITLVDDASTDATHAIARGIISVGEALGKRLDVIAGRPLRAPWTGKLNALATGVTAARERRGEPDYWLFTDADIVHDSENVAALVAKARHDDLSLVSLMVRLRCESGWERLLVPAFIFFFRKLYPFAWSNDPRRGTAAAAGGCVLVRADALAAIGGLGSIGDRLIDDCALAAAVKASGGKTWIGLTAKTASIRPYGDLESFWRMVKRTAFTQLGRSYTVTFGATLGMLLLYVAPPTLTIVGAVRRDARTTALAGLAWATMSAIYVPTLRAQRRPWRETLGLPFAAVLYTLMTIDSAVAHARGEGGAWKGRTYGTTGARDIPSETAEVPGDVFFALGDDPSGAAFGLVAPGR